MIGTTIESQDVPVLRVIMSTFVVVAHSILMFQIKLMKYFIDLISSCDDSQEMGGTLHVQRPNHQVRWKITGTSQTIVNTVVYKYMPSNHLITTIITITAKNFFRLKGYSCSLIACV